VPGFSLPPPAAGAGRAGWVPRRSRAAPPSAGFGGRAGSVAGGCAGATSGLRAGWGAVVAARGVPGAIGATEAGSGVLAPATGAALSARAGTRAGLGVAALGSRRGPRPGARRPPQARQDPAFDSPPRVPTAPRMRLAWLDRNASACSGVSSALRMRRVRSDWASVILARNPWGSSGAWGPGAPWTPDGAGSAVGALPLRRRRLPGSGRGRRKWRRGRSRCGAGCPRRRRRPARSDVAVADPPVERVLDRAPGPLSCPPRRPGPLPPVPFPPGAAGLEASAAPVARAMRRSMASMAVWASASVISPLRSRRTIEARISCRSAGFSPVALAPERGRRERPAPRPGHGAPRRDRRWRLPGEPRRQGSRKLRKSRNRRRLPGESSGPRPAWRDAGSAVAWTRRSGRSPRRPTGGPRAIRWPPRTRPGRAGRRRPRPPP
jgi:hypothetical protein